MELLLVKTAVQVTKKVIRVNKSTPILDLADIILIEGRVNYSLIQTKHNSIICTKTLKFFEKNINDKRFIRTHKSHIVNIDYVQRHRRIDGVYVLELKNGQLIDVARRRSQHVSNYI